MKCKSKSSAAIHLRVKRNNNMITPKYCSNCGKKARLDLAFRKHNAKIEEYTENPEDYVWLCRKCHMLADGRMELLSKVRIKGGNKKGCYRATKETKLILSRKAKAQFLRQGHPSLGRKHSLETRKKISDGMKLFNKKFGNPRWIYRKTTPEPEESK